MGSDRTLTCVARRPCGCLCFAAVIEDEMDGKRRTEIAREVGKLAMEGLQIETIPVEDARKGPWVCSACEEKEETEGEPREGPLNPNQTELELQAKGGRSHDKGCTHPA